MPALAAIRSRAAAFSPRKMWFRSLSQRAAVAVVVADRPGLGCSLLMIQRAKHESDPWSGQMAFPGGKHETDDAHITATALRETREELGIPPEKLLRFGRLSDVMARPYHFDRAPMVISPLLLYPTAELAFQPNHEVDDVVWVPVSHFLEVANRSTMTRKIHGQAVERPCYEYQGKVIWGLSLLMIDELVRELVT